MNVDADPSTAPDVEPAAHEHVRAQARAGAGAEREGLVRRATWTGAYRTSAGVAVDVAAIAAPVRQMVAAPAKRSVGPDAVHSSPGAPSGLPRMRFPSRNERSSIGPLGGTPTCQ